MGSFDGWWKFFFSSLLKNKNGFLPPKLLPKRLDWLGNSHLRGFNEIVSWESLLGTAWPKHNLSLAVHSQTNQNQHIPPDFLLRICNQLRQLIEKQLNNKFTSTNSLLGCGQYSLLQGDISFWNAWQVFTLLTVQSKAKSYSSQVYIITEWNLELTETLRSRNKSELEISIRFMSKRFDAQGLFSFSTQANTPNKSWRV